jgi:hypothetical protein
MKKIGKSQQKTCRDAQLRAASTKGKKGKIGKGQLSSSFNNHANKKKSAKRRDAQLRACKKKTFGKKSAL